METVWRFVNRQRVLFPIECELPIFDPVSDSTNNAAKVRRKTFLFIMKSNQHKKLISTNITKFSSIKPHNSVNSEISRTIWIADKERSTQIDRQKKRKILPNMGRENQIQGLHQPIFLQSCIKSMISNLTKENPQKNWTEKCKYKVSVTIFAWNRERSDGATKIGNENLHGSIVELEKLRFLSLIRHWNTRREREEK